MELTSLPSLIFSPSADDISIAAEGDVVVRVMLSSHADRTVFDNTSTYSPGSDGNVHIVDLSELVNAVVLSQHHNTSERILRHIANAYRLIYQGNFSVQDAVHKIIDQVPMSEEIENIVNFVKGSERGIVK